MNRKYLIIAIIIIIVFFFVFFYLFSRRGLSLGSRENAINSIDSLNSYKGEWPDKLISKSDMCVKLGGKMIDTGCGLAECHSECSKIYSDGGKNCKSSNDCQGRCIIEEPNKFITGDWWEFISSKCKKKMGGYFCSDLEFKFSGECESVQEHGCEGSPWELNGQNIESIERHCVLG